VLARTVRSGLVEAVHPGSVVAVDAAGSIIGRWGEPEGPFFMRSAAKPIQATVSTELGGALPAERLALSTASHHGEPVHLAVVRSILADVGLDEHHLRCPPAWPVDAAARDRLVAAGETAPKAIYHNCSGKHAAMLRACVAQDWDPATYTDPRHPLQIAVTETVAEVSGEDPTPVGVDGCGVPAFRATVAGLARVFAAVAFSARYRPVAEAMHRYPALVCGTRAPQARIPLVAHAAVKGGAMGCIGVAVLDQVAVAAKAGDGSFEAAVVAVIAALRELGYDADTALGAVDSERIPVLGGGRVVGHLEPAIASASGVAG
jgi:L-asparaginase II